MLSTLPFLGLLNQTNNDVGREPVAATAAMLCLSDVFLLATTQDNGSAWGLNGALGTAFLPLISPALPSRPKW